MSDAKNVQNGGMSRRVSDIHDMLLNMQIVDPSYARDFVDRLADDQEWPRDRAQRAYDEYVRFLLMAWISPVMVVPSHDVDQAWHLHLTHTRHYWEVLCGRILQKPLHHDPSTESGDETARHEDHYGKTLALYEHLFDEAAPEDVWPRGCACAPRTVDRPELVLASPAAVGIGAVGFGTVMMLYMAEHPVAALAAACVTIFATIVALGAAARDREDEERSRTATRTTRTTSFAPRYAAATAEPTHADLAARLSKAREETAALSARARAKPAPYGSSGRTTRSSGGSRGTTQDSSGSDAMAGFAAILASDDGSSSQSSHSHSSSSHSHSSHSCGSSSSSHSSHSCGSSSSHSCGGSSSSCGGSSCGGSSCGSS